MSEQDSTSRDQVVKLPDGVEGFAVAHMSMQGKKQVRVTHRPAYAESAFGVRLPAAITVSFGLSSVSLPPDVWRDVAQAVLELHANEVAK